MSIRTTFLFTLIWLSSLAQADEHITWNKAPIDVSLKIGLERQIVFDEPVEIGIQQTAMNRFKTLASVSQRLFIEPSASFQKQRILVKNKANGDTYVLFLSTVEKNIALDPVVRIHTETMQPKSGPFSHRINEKQNNTANINAYPFLTRYVAQQLYAPDRLLKTVAGIQRVSVQNKSFRSLFRCTQRSTACNSILAKPIISFKTDKLYASAIEIQNISDYPVDIDPRLAKSIRSGSLLSSVPIHGRLLPARFGNRSKSVIIFVHKRPLIDTFGGLQ